VGTYLVERSYRRALDGHFIQFDQAMQIGEHSILVHAMIGWHAAKQRVAARSFSSDGSVTITEFDPAGVKIVFEGVRQGGVNAGRVRGTFEILGQREFTETAEVWRDGVWVPIFQFHFARKVAGK